MTELQILSAVKNNGGSMNYVELLNLGLTDPVRDSIADKQLIEKLIREKILSGETEAYSRITFGKEGRLRLRDLQQSEDEIAKHVADIQSDKKADKRFQTSQTLIGIILGAVCTLIVEILLKVIFG